ncbi:hypothetical protein Lal_00024317 [Lupinus albus]|nr:hypothetical protein Lal_00024317 [Lupinus albus]
MSTQQRYFDIGDPTYECGYCGTCMWYQERTKKLKTPKIPKFQLCCGVGNIDRSPSMMKEDTPSFRIQGQTCHLIGSLLSMLGIAPKFAQLYIYDTENEIQNRLA